MICSSLFLLVIRVITAADRPKLRTLHDRAAPHPTACRPHSSSAAAILSMVSWSDSVAARPSPYPSSRWQNSRTTTSFFFVRRYSRSPSIPSNCVPSFNFPLQSITIPLASFSRSRPIASYRSNVNPIGSIRLWHTMHDASLVCFSTICRVVMPAAALFLRQLGHIRRRPGQLLSQQRLHHPVPAQHRARSRCRRLLRLHAPQPQNPTPPEFPHPLHLPPRRSRQRPESHSAWPAARSDRCKSASSSRAIG